MLPKGFTLDTSGKKSRLYHIYEDMKARCYNPKRKNFHRYGGRGIKICEEWLQTYMNFYSWAMANGYSDNLEIDRINNDGNYEPINCKWSTKVEQAVNRSTNVLIEYNGRVQTLSQWANELKMCPNTLKKRLKKWPKIKAFTEPVKLNFRQNAA